MPEVCIRPATPSDLSDVLRVERAAFGQDDEARLVDELLGDPTARPIVSLVAEEDGVLVGHILLTGCALDTLPDVPLMLLAPLAVVPEYQRQGVGAALSRAALQAAEELGAHAVFVLGHVEYYPKHGFVPALPMNLEAPYPIPAEIADAWMVAETRPGFLGTARGRVQVAEVLMEPEYWRE